MDAATHHYSVSCSWSGSTADGYDAYERAHRATIGGVQGVLDLSADPAFGGDPSTLNPEQLVVLAASSCQLLSFLAVAARARIAVVDYTDDAEGFMPEDDQPVRITSILLRPRIQVAPGPTLERILHLTEVAHRECFIANSLRSEIRIEPTVVFG